MIEQIRRCDECKEVIPEAATVFSLEGKVSRQNGRFHSEAINGEWCSLDCMTKAVQHAATNPCHL